MSNVKKRVKVTSTTVCSQVFLVCCSILVFVEFNFVCGASLKAPHSARGRRSWQQHCDGLERHAAVPRQGRMQVQAAIELS